MVTLLAESVSVFLGDLGSDFEPVSGSLDLPEDRSALKRNASLWVAVVIVAPLPHSPRGTHPLPAIPRATPRFSLPFPIA
jgi:hypothetical protein